MDKDCMNEGRIMKMELQTAGMLEAMQKIEGKIDIVLQQVNKISILEMNHTQHTEAFNRAFKRIEELEDDSKKTEKFISHTQGMAKMAWIIWSAMGISVVTLIVKIFGGS